MNKRIIKFYLILSLLMLIIFLMHPTTALATDEGNDFPEGIPSNATKYIVEMEVPPAEQNNWNEENNIMTYIWDNKTPNLSNGQESTIATFATTDRNLGFESSAVVIDGGNPVGNCGINLYEGNGHKTGVSIFPNGSMIKKDNISIDGQSTYHFRVSNQTGVTIRVNLVFYSW